MSHEADQPLSEPGAVTHEEEQDVQETLTESELQSGSDQRTITSHQGVEAVTRLRIIRPHAEGGLGRVSVALDNRLNRQVAFKEIKPRHADNRNARQRFILEAEITGGLEHPGIVPVYGLGQFDDGRPFYAMRFIQGQSLHEASEAFHESVNDDLHGSRANLDFASTVGFRQLISRFIDVCNAVGYAHSRGVLHRDLKPGNIMVGNYGETLVVDWGLAKATGDSGTNSNDADTLTAEGRVNELNQTSDIYSLGATLYQLLTGCRPMARSRTGQESSSPSVKETLRRVREGHFARPRTVNSSVPLRLEAVCLKAMALQQADRYQTTEELAADLEAWLADQPVSAVKESSVGRMRRWIRHHETAVGTVTATVVVTSMALLILLAVVAATNGRLLEANTRALASEKDARQNADRAERNAIEADEQKNLAKQIAEESRIQADRAEKAAARAVAESRRSEQTTRFVARLFQASNSTGFLGFGVGRRPEDDNTLTAAEVLARGRKRLATELSTAPLLRASLMDTLGDVYRGVASTTTLNCY